MTAPPLLLLLAVAVGLSVPAAAEIKTESFREDRRSSIMFEKFGFSNPSSTPSTRRGRGPTAEKRAAATGGDDPEARSGCVLSSPYVKKLFTFHDMEGGHYNKSFPVTHPDEYTPLLR
ncbi:hypothetical protein PR202_ga05377 [Eleusine coracana subsp. coracana]|uniref:CAND6/7 N-terminal domain-containing protein n=1 Tax=Eleusine coracana subsp. coracana TaxID=191504 RepID=A0AAV5BS80_ELECO|nr:hypothetical protein PR202_ga04924 [Eleusine coracana subsp. coracana]GJM89212.1 hypothetical protein PR202_ga05377 [Eleusine coracana subsp. coracana]